MENSTIEVTLIQQYQKQFHVKRLTVVMHTCSYDPFLDTINMIPFRINISGLIIHSLDDGSFLASFDIGLHENEFIISWPYYDVTCDNIYAIGQLCLKTLP